MKYLQYLGFVFTFFCSSIFCSASINQCIDGSGNIIFTDNDCPNGFTKKGGQKRPKITKKTPDIQQPKEVNSTILWEKYQLSFDEIEMSWRLTKGTKKEPSIISPQLTFSVGNNGAEAVLRLKLILLFKDSNGNILGDTFKYIRHIDPGQKAESVSMSPDRGYSYDAENDYNDLKKNLILDTKLKVDIVARYMGEKVTITTLDFTSDQIK